MLGASRDCFYNFIFTMSWIEVSNKKSFLDLNIKTGGLIMMITQMNLGHAKHLTWVFSAKIVDRFQSLTIFTKKFSSQMFVRVLNFPLQNNKERDKKTTKANSCKKMLTKHKILIILKRVRSYAVHKTRSVIQQEQTFLSIVTHFITAYHISLGNVPTNYCINNPLILDAKQLKKS